MLLAVQTSEKKKCMEYLIQVPKYVPLFMNICYRT